MKNIFPSYPPYESPTKISDQLTFRKAPPEVNWELVLDLDALSVLEVNRDLNFGGTDLGGSINEFINGGTPKWMVSKCL